jgi:hypothetical protein
MAMEESPLCGVCHERTVAWAVFEPLICFDYSGGHNDRRRPSLVAIGNAVSTVYGHMHHYMVSVGQRVSKHAQIGSLGSTGRSSGPHVHYEILVNGEPQDPESFIALVPLMSVTRK